MKTDQHEADQEDPVGPGTPWLKGTWIACGQLTAAMLIAVAVMGWLAHRSHGSEGLLASAVAGGVCWLGALLALLAISRTRGGKRAVTGILISMACREGFVLCAFLVLRQWSDKIGQSKLVLHLLPYYGTALVVGTVLIIRLIQRTESGAEVS